MILINLLPHREVAKKAGKNRFTHICLLSILVGVGFSGITNLYIQHQIDMQQEANYFLESNNIILAGKVEEVNNIVKESNILKSYQKAVESLQEERNLSVYLFNTLSEQTPAGLYITSINQTDKNIFVEGLAISNQVVSVFLDNLQSKMVWHTEPKLKETKAVDFVFDNKKTRRLFTFALSFQLKGKQNESADINLSDENKGAKE